MLCQGGKLSNQLISRTWWNSGATMNSMKLVWLMAGLVLVRSIMGDTATPAARSVSPCLKNSARTRPAHLLTPKL